MYNEFVEILKKYLEMEQEKLRLYRDGKLRSMTLEADRWYDSTVVAIEETKQRIAELKPTVAKYEQAPVLISQAGKRALRRV